MVEVMMNDNLAKTETSKTFHTWGKAFKYAHNLYKKEYEKMLKKYKGTKDEENIWGFGEFDGNDEEGYWVSVERSTTPRKGSCRSTEEWIDICVKKV